jgi:micrococcal nuclease
MTMIQKFRIGCALALLMLFIGCRQDRLVTEVIDGDTFRLGSGESVRLLGINAPEMSDPGGDIAKDFLTVLLRDKRVRLVRDISDQDDYKRLLRHVYVNRTNINAEMIRLGYAEARFYPPDTLHAAEFKELEKIAIRNRRGLWIFPVFQVPDTTGIAEKTAVLSDQAEVIPHTRASRYYGKSMTVEGTIVVSNNTGKVCFLNFNRNWKNGFTAVIFASDFASFPPHPEDYYLNRTVQVTGLIKEYKGKPEIIVKSPNQIKIVR